MEKVLKKNFFFMGIFSTLGAFMLNLGGTTLAVFNLFLLSAILIKLLTNRINLYKYKIPLILWALCFVLSTIVGVYVLDNGWIQESFKFTVKFILFLFPYTFLFNDEEMLNYRQDYFRGVLGSCFIQLFWEFAQIVLWSAAGLSLNQIIFSDILHIQIKNSWTFITDGTFRPAGVSWEPANLALSLVTGYVLSSSKYSKALFILGIALSTSRTGILGLAIVMGFQFTIFRKKRADKKKTTKKDVLILIAVIGVVSVALTIILKNSTDLVDYISDGIESTFDKMTNMDEDSSALTHSQYYQKIPLVLEHGSIINHLFGFGTSSAGFPYAKYLNIYSQKVGWNPESDIITMLFGNGIIGLILYYSVLIKNLILNKEDEKGRLLIVAIAFSGIFYLYIRGSWSVMLLFMLYVRNGGNPDNFILNENIKRNEEKKRRKLEKKLKRRERHNKIESVM